MNCALCSGRLVKKRESVEFKSKSIGKVIVPNLEFLGCEECKDKLFTSKESDRAIDFIAKKEMDAIYNLPAKDFITAKEACKILGITKQAFSKHPKIKRGLIYFIKIGNRKYYNRKSVEVFKEKGNGKYLLKHETHSTYKKISTPKIFVYYNIHTPPMLESTKSGYNGWTQSTSTMKREMQYEHK